jgi:hypothetical protein
MFLNIFSVHLPPEADLRPLRQAAPAPAPAALLVRGRGPGQRGHRGRRLCRVRRRRRRHLAPSATPLQRGGPAPGTVTLPIFTKPYNDGSVKVTKLNNSESHF